MVEKNKNAGNRILDSFLGDARRDILFRFLFWGTVATFSVMVACAWLQVISRYFFNMPLGWTDEMSLIMMFWFAFLSIGVLARRRRLMMVDAFVVFLPRRGRLILSAIVQLGSAACLAWVAFLCVRLMELAEGQLSTAMKIPYSLIYLSLPIGLAGAVVYLAAVGIADLRLAISVGPGETGRAKRQLDV